jgi:hypothetical protein
VAVEEKIVSLPGSLFIHLSLELASLLGAVAGETVVVVKGGLGRNQRSGAFTVFFFQVADDGEEGEADFFEFVLVFFVGEAAALPGLAGELVIAILRKGNLSGLRFRVEAVEQFQETGVPVISDGQVGEVLYPGIKRHVQSEWIVYFATVKTLYKKESAS